MANPDIVNYIKEARKAGNSDDVIKSALTSQGWNASDVDDALRELSEHPAENAGPEAKPAETSRKPSEGGEMEKKSALRAVLRVIFFLGCFIGGIAGFIVIFINEWIGRLIMVLAIAGLGYGIYSSLHDRSKLKYLNIAVKAIAALILLFMLIRNMW